MAEGVLLVLGGEERFRKEAYLGLEKVYEAGILLGFRSDTGDGLGRITADEREIIGAIATAVSGLEGTRVRPVPRWSSVSVEGRSSVRRMRMGEEPPPVERPMTVIQSHWLGTDTSEGRVIHAEMYQRISRVTGDFRQEQALQDWERCINPTQPYTVIHLRLRTASGVYVRSLAEELGAALGTSALLYSLRRTEVGNYTDQMAVRLRSP
jgi:tRNA pseudouridine55 synthase